MTASSSSSAAATAAATALVGDEKKKTGELRWEAASASIPHPRKADTGGCVYVYVVALIVNLGGEGLGASVRWVWEERDVCVGVRFLFMSCTQLS